jgi:hypothetical protein
MMKRSILKVTQLIALSALVLLVSACSEKGLNGGDSTTSVSMSFKVTSPGMIDLVSQFRVIVTADDFETPIESPLTLNGRYLEGIVEVPAGPDRLFTVMANDVEGKVLYQGDTTLTIDGNADVELLINLYPQVSLIRVSPRYLEVPAGAVFSVDIRVFNVRDLYGASFRLYWQGAIIRPDSAVPLAPPGTDWIFFDQIDRALSFYAFTISQTDQISPIVDSTGDADLARVFFSSFTPDIAPQTASLSVKITELKVIYADSIGSMPIDGVSVDGSRIVVGSPGI